MPVHESNSPTLTRAQVSEQKFKHQIAKAFRKGKLVEVLYQPKNNDIYDTVQKPECIIIDPALLLFECNLLETENDDAFLSWREIVYDYLRIDPVPKKEVEPVSLRFYILNTTEIINGVSASKRLWELCKLASVDGIYKKIEESDPTPNKEYVQWILALYTRVLKDRTPKTSFTMEENKLGGFAYLFFEDLHKLPDAIKFFHKIKNSKALTVEQRDVYAYKSINNFIETVFLSQAESTAPDAIPTNVLNARELDALARKTAEIVYQDPSWIIVHTIDKEGSRVFGENTTWCTAGSNYGSMFDNYNRQGKLFILLKNKPGASAHLRANPTNRLQFHFESSQFHDVTNHSIDVLKFFNENIGVKSYFRTYILEKLMKPKTSISEMMSLLKKFGMVRDLIPLLKEAKIKVLDLSDLVGKGNEFDIQDIGEIDTLEELTIRGCGLTKIPSSIQKLTRLKILRLSGNDITEIPEWINKLVNLEVLILMRNDIQAPFNISGLKNLVELHLAFNKSLTAVPIGIENLTNMTFLDMSFCNIKEVGDNIMKCSALVNLNLARNRNLRKIPDNLMNLPSLLALTLDDTGIPLAKQREMESRKQNNQTTII